MEPSVVNLYNQFQSLRAQVDGLNEGIEPRKLFPHFVLVFATSQPVGETQWSLSICVACGVVKLVCCGMGLRLVAVIYNKMR